MSCSGLGIDVDFGEPVPRRGEHAGEVSVSPSVAYCLLRDALQRCPPSDREDLLEDWSSRTVQSIRRFVLLLTVDLTQDGDQGHHLRVRRAVPSVLDRSEVRDRALRDELLNQVRDQQRGHHAVVSWSRRCHDRQVQCHNCPAVV